MRILFATSIKSWGGGEEWMLSAARGLAERGHQVALAARPGSAIDARASGSAIERVDVPFARDFDPASMRIVHAFCRSWRPDLLCLNMDRTLRTAGVAARLAGVRSVIPRRGSEFPLKDGWIYRWTYQRVATSMIVNSRATERALLQGVTWRPAGRIHVLLNGVDARRFDRPRPRAEIRAALGVPGEAFLIATIGELTTRKNPALLVRALRRPGAPPAHAIFAGEGPERERIVEEARAAGIDGRVHVLGFRDDVPDLLGASDLLVHVAHVEGFGYAIAEAMMAGIPTVASRVSSIPEIVEDGVTGILVPPDDADALARAIDAYARDPERRRRDGAAGRARAHAEFDLERRTDELEAIFDQEIRRTSSPPRSAGTRSGR
jgi:glycosyltransferase involved in cell wall biosynthesis